MGSFLPSFIGTVFIKTTESVTNDLSTILFLFIYIYVHVHIYIYIYIYYTHTYTITKTKYVKDNNAAEQLTLLWMYMKQVNIAPWFIFFLPITLDHLLWIRS